VEDANAVLFVSVMRLKGDCWRFWPKG